MSSDRFLPVVVKSTVVPGTTDTVVRGELEAASGKSLGSFGLGMNAEFLREGAAVADFMEPDRIVLGYEDETTLSALEQLYAVWDCDKIRVNTRTAELIKYANNALLATQISAINEIANLAEAIGDIDMIEVAQGLHLDRRWNPVTDLGQLWPTFSPTWCQGADSVAAACQKTCVLCSISAKDPVCPCKCCGRLSTSTTRSP